MQLVLVRPQFTTFANTLYINETRMIGVLHLIYSRTYLSCDGAGHLIHSLYSDRATRHISSFPSISHSPGLNMTRKSDFYAVAMAVLVPTALAQAGPNTLAVYNPANRTTSLNATFCILPIPKNVVKIVTGYDPLDVPTSILPSFPPNMHPLLLQGSYQNDIRMTALNIAPLQIPGLTQASLIIPYTDVTKDGRTPIGFPVNYYIGGIDGKDLEALVPSIVSGISPFEGTTIAPASIVPDDAAVQSLPKGLYNFQAKPYILPNSVSGPGVMGEAIDLLYELTQQSPYTSHTFHSLLNIPQLLNTGLCQRVSLYFNESFAGPQMGRGNATLYHQPLLSTPPTIIAGTYKDVYCYQGNAELVASYIGESCPVAAARADPAAKE